MVGGSRHGTHLLPSVPISFDRFTAAEKEVARSPDKTMREDPVIVQYGWVTR